MSGSYAAKILRATRLLGGASERAICFEELLSYCGEILESVWNLTEVRFTCEQPPASPSQCCYRLELEDGSTLWLCHSAAEELPQALLDQFSQAFHEFRQSTPSHEENRYLSERLKLALQTGKLGVFDWDIRNQRVTWDDAAYRIYGVSRTDFGNDFESWLGCLHPEDRERARNEVCAVLKSGFPLYLDFRILRPDGQIRHIHSEGTVLYDKSGEAIRLIGVNRDQTDEVLARLERDNLSEQLLQAQKMESVGRLAGSIAHDFNNVLSIIVGNAELARLDLGDNALCAEALTEIEQASRRAAEITQKILAAARKQQGTPRSLELNRIVDSTVNMIRRLLGEEIDLLWEPGQNLWAIHSDPSHIDQILLNLCVNSRDAIANYGTVRIRTRNVLDYGHEYVELIFQDTGCGMTEEVKKRVFEPYFTTKTAEEGTGLGLSTISRIVEMNKARIELNSEPGKGTTISIRWPRYVGPAENAAPPRSVRLSGSEKIMLVEDHPIVLGVAKRMLENLGYEVTATRSASEAVRLGTDRNSNYSLLITDVIMPEMNGRQLADRLKILNPSLKCLFMSGYTNDVLCARGVRGEDANFLRKPFSQDELQWKVQSLNLDTDCSFN